MGAVAFADRRRGVRDVLAALSARQIAWLVFLSTLLIYFALVPWVSRRWWLIGDEPHYLMVTHSLLTDGDLELSNNYQEKDFTLFYVGDRIDPHVAIGRDGGAYPAHTIGLSVLLLPAYAFGYLVFGSHAGVLYFLNVIGALLAANVYLLCYEVTGRRFSSLLGWVTTAFTVPVMHYAYQVYPEIIGALLLVWSLRHIRQGERTKPHIWLMVGVCIGFLPWLVSRFIVLSALLGAMAFYCIATEATARRYRRLSIIALCLPVVFFAILLIAFNFHFYGGIVPVVGYAGSGETFIDLIRLPSLGEFATGLVAWLFDQDAGLFIYAPVYFISLPGLFLLLKDRRRDGIPLFLPVLGMYLALAWQGFWPAWNIPVRYLVAVLPVLGIFVVHAIQRINSVVFTTIFLMLLLLSMATGGLLMIDPELPQAYYLHGKAGLLVKYGNLLSTDIERYVPSFREKVTILHADGPWPGEIGKAVLDPQVIQSHTGQLGLGWWVTKAETESQDEGYIFDRQWPDEEYAQFLPAGEYSACFGMRTEDSIAGDIVVAIVDVSTSESTLARKEVRRSEFATKGYSVFCIDFRYPGGKPLRFRVVFTDQADLWLHRVSLARLEGSSRRWVISGFWLVAIGAFTAYYYLRYRNKHKGPDDEISSGQFKVGGGRGNMAFKIAVALLLLLTIFALGIYLYSLFSPRLFEAEGLSHLTGEVVIDEGASGGKAAYASRDMEKNTLVYGPYEFFRPAEYEVRFRMKRGDASTEVEVATIDVYGNASGVLALGAIESNEFEETNKYQDFLLTFQNPAPQALQFRVHFLGVADLWVDKIMVERLDSNGLGGDESE
jgi:hypothetical protein